MIEWLLSGLVRILSWLWSSAVTLYYLAGFFVVLGGLVIFTGSIIHHYWKRSLENREAVRSQEPRTSVHIENLNVTIELTEAQLQRLLREQARALPVGTDPEEQDPD